MGSTRTCRAHARHVRPPAGRNDADLCLLPAEPGERVADAAEGSLGAAPTSGHDRLPCSRACLCRVVAVLLVGRGGQIGSAEGAAPDAVEVVLGLAHVQGECATEEPGLGEGFLQAGDRAGGWLEVRLQVVGGRVVGCASGAGQRPTARTLSQLWQSRFHGQEPPSTRAGRCRIRPRPGCCAATGRSPGPGLARGRAGRPPPASSSPGLDVPGPATQTCCRTSCRSD